MTAPVSRASKRALLVTLFLITLSVLLFRGIGDDSFSQAASTTAEWAKSNFNRLDKPQSTSSTNNHTSTQVSAGYQKDENSPSSSHTSSGTSSGTSEVRDPCQNDPIIPQEMVPQSADGTRVLITGGAGFIGSNLADRLIELGYKVRILDNLYTGFIRNVPLQKKGVEFIHGDILNPQILKRAIKDVDFVYHLAAMSKVLPSVRDPEMAKFCVENNAIGSWNVLNATREHSAVKKVVYAGSSTYYGNKPIPHNEDAAADFLTPYAASKYEGEIQMQMFDRLFGVPTITMRFFMVYGPRQPTTGAYAIVTGVFARQASQNTPLTIEGDGTHFRDFIHVNDIVTGLILSQQRKDLRGGIPINLGSGTSFSVKDVADMVSPNQVHVAERKNDLVGTLADTCRMKELLKYNAKTDFRKEMSFMAEETMKGNVFAQGWVTPLLALSVPFILPSGSPILPWAAKHSSIEQLLVNIEKVQTKISDSEIEKENLISIIPFGGREEDMETQAQLLANTVYSLVRFGGVRQYIVAAMSPLHLESCQDYNMPCFEATKGVASLIDSLLPKYNVHVAALGTVTVDNISNMMVAGADVTSLKHDAGFILRSRSTPASHDGGRTDLLTSRASSDFTFNELISTLLTTFTGKDNSITVKSVDADSLCTTEEEDIPSTAKAICPKTPVIALSCREKKSASYPDGVSGKIRSLRKAGLWMLSQCTHGTYCDKQQYIPLRWIQGTPDLSTSGRFC